TFADINRKPNWIVAALITIVVAFAVNFVVIKRLNPDWKAINRKQVEKSLKKQGKTMADLPEEQRNAIEKQIEIGAKFSGYVAFLFPIIIPLIGIVFLALIFWGCATIMGGQTTYKKVLSLTTYIFGTVTVVVQSLLALLVVFLRNPDDIDLTKGIAVTNPGM